MNGDGSGVTCLGVVGVEPVWSPDGSRIAFESSGGACEDFCNGSIYTATLTVTDHDGLTGTQRRTFDVIQW